MRAIIHADLVLPGRIVKDAVVLMDGGRIAAAGKDIEIPGSAEIFDAQGAIVGPGFVDIHVHGSGQENRSWDSDPEAVAAYHLRHGTTSICAYFTYGYKPETLYPAVEMCQRVIDSGSVPSVMGIGFEGPYTSPYLGAHLGTRGFTTPKAEEYEHLYELCHGRVVQWMYAPEVDRDGRFPAFLRQHRIVTAVGHTAASPAQIRQAVDRGATVATHLFDAMGCHLGSRSVEITGTIQDSTAVGCLICPELTYEIIPDQNGVHVKKSNMQLVYQLAGPHRICIITDCTWRDYDPADYGPDELRSDVAINYATTDRDTVLGGVEVAGSCLTMDRAFRNFIRHTGASVADAFLMASTTPAKTVRVDDQVGSIVPGKYADLVVLDEDLQLRKVFFRGEEVAR